MNRNEMSIDQNNGTTEAKNPGLVSRANGANEARFARFKAEAELARSQGAGVQIFAEVLDGEKGRGFDVLRVTLAGSSTWVFDEKGPVAIEPFSEFTSHDRVFAVFAGTPGNLFKLHRHRDFFPRHAWQLRALMEIAGLWGEDFQGALAEQYNDAGADWEIYLDIRCQRVVVWPRTPKDVAEEQQCA